MTATTATSTTWLGQRLLALAKPTAFILLGLLLWEAIVAFGLVPRYALAAPTQVASYMARNPLLLFTHLQTTLGEVLLAFVISMTAGVIVGVLITQFRVLEEGVMPLLVFLQVIPVIALAPLLVLLLGFGIWPKVAVATLISFLPVVINTITGMKSLPTEVADLAAVLRANKLQTLWMFSLPNALPTILAGARIAVGLCVIGAVVGEFITSESGLGYLVLAGTAALDPAQVFAAIVTLAFLGIALFAAVGALNWLLLPWARRRVNS